MGVVCCLLFVILVNSVDFLYFFFRLFLYVFGCLRFVLVFIVVLFVERLVVIVYCC